jgi:asparagine synthase (glutamine-hydrolysing)
MKLPDSSARGRRLAEELRSELTGKGLLALLRHADRNSMRWSVENRVPFLTTPLAEYMLALPERYMVSQGGETKHVFRAAMKGIVPDEVLGRRDKIGFATPEKSWMAQLAPQLIRWVAAVDDIPFICPDLYRQELLSIAKGQMASSHQAWRMFNFARWYGHQTGLHGR